MVTKNPENIDNFLAPKDPKNLQNKNSKILDLFREGAAGDKNSYQSFLVEISKILRLVISKKVKAADAEDVLQEVLISIHKATHTFDFNRPLMPWIMAIARFRIADYLRSHYDRMSHKTVCIDDLLDELVDVTFEAKNDELVNEIMLNIDQKQRKILTMMYIEGYTAKEVGLSLGMNESAIKVAAHRLVKKLKQQFVKK